MYSSIRLAQTKKKKIGAIYLPLSVLIKESAIFRVFRALDNRTHCWMLAYTRNVNPLNRAEMQIPSRVSFHLTPFAFAFAYDYFYVWAETAKLGQPCFLFRFKEISSKFLSHLLILVKFLARTTNKLR